MNYWTEIMHIPTSLKLRGVERIASTGRIINGQDVMVVEERKKIVDAESKLMIRVY